MKVRSWLARVARRSPTARHLFSAAIPIPPQLLDNATQPDTYKFWTDLRLRYIPQILSQMPEEWRGTTFSNDARLLGRERFSRNISELVIRKAVEREPITVGELRQVGYADDYFRVGSNVSTLLEMAVSTHSFISRSTTFAISSQRMSLPFSP